MVLALLVLGFALLGLPGLLRPACRHLPPAEWARINTASLVAGAGIIEAALVVCAGPTLLRSMDVTSWAHVCERLLGPLIPGHSLVGWAAAVLAVAVPVSAGVGAVRGRRALDGCRADPWLGEHGHFRGHELVVLPIGEPLAVAVGGDPAQILLSEGLIGLLDPAQLEAVLRHEAAHLERGHHRHLLVATAVDWGLGWLPGVRASTRALRVSLERWADEEAAGPTLSGRAAVREALLGVAMAMVDPPRAAFATLETIQERLEALDRLPHRPSPAWRAVVYGPAMTLVAAVTLTFGVWAGQASSVVGLTGHCPA